MDVTVFYSWQSDLPNSTNRSFVELALQAAIDEIAAQNHENKIELVPVLDRDTSGVPGSPEIASTIFSKIDRAGVFVADVSRINPGSSSRPTPNPNVLIELGYAIRTLGIDRVILVANLAYGTVEDLPFDIRPRRVMTYTVPKDAQDKSTERKQLGRKFEEALSAIFAQIKVELEQNAPPEPESFAAQAINAFNLQQPQATNLTRRFIQDFMTRLEAIDPKPTGPDGDELFLKALEDSIPLVVEFLRVVESSSINGSQPALEAIHDGFEKMLEHYNPPQGFSGTFYDADYDFFKFLGHELFVSMIALLIREEKWQIIGDLLEKSIYVNNTKTGTPGLMEYTEISQHLFWLRHRNERLNLRRVSLHADILEKRHGEGALSELVPIELFAEADYFLFLRGAFMKLQDRLLWRAWSILDMKRIPVYLVKAIRINYASQLLKPFGVDTIEEFREQYRQNAHKVEALYKNVLWHFEIPDLPPENIGSK